MAVILIVILMGIIIFFLGVGCGGVHVGKKVHDNVKMLERTIESDGQFRDIIVNTYAPNKNI